MIVGSVLGTVALVLLIAGLIAGTEALLIVLAGDLVLLWAVATIRHAARVQHRSAGSRGSADRACQVSGDSAAGRGRCWAVCSRRRVRRQLDRDGVCDGD